MLLIYLCPSPSSYVTEGAELANVLKKRAFQTAMIQAVGKGNAVE